MNNRVKILLTLCAVLGLVLAALGLKRRDRNADGAENSIAAVGAVLGDKTYRSKIAAYDAYANEKEQFYNRSARAFVPEPAAQSPKEPPSGTPEPSRPVPEPAEDPFDEAYAEIAQNMDQIYREDGTPARMKPQTPLAVQIPDASERRREAMLRDWGMNRSSGKPSSGSGMFRAVIHGTQTIKAGQTALFRTKEEIRYGDFVVPANTLLTGLASVSENRLTIGISFVRLGREVHPLPLEVYGSDGMPGIPLNYDAAGKIADAQASSAATREISSAASRYGGTIGRVAGTLISGVGNQVRNLKNVEVKLIDNQTVILKIAEQR